ncbi:MAG: hemerythrin domain-containing protein [Acidobacteriota bacterium]
MSVSKWQLQQIDPLTKQPEVGAPDMGMSPMDPPEVYSPPAVDEVAVDDMHPFLRGLCEEHAALSHVLGVVEEALKTIKATGFTAEVEAALLGFCQVVEYDFVPHSRREEIALFPMLHDRLIADGEHGTGKDPMTPVDIMLADHLKVIQFSAVVDSLVRLASRLVDDNSALILRDAAVRHTRNLVALLRLHMFREENILFTSAHRLIQTSQLDRMPFGVSGPTECDRSGG